MTDSTGAPSPVSAFIQRNVGIATRNGIASFFISFFFYLKVIQ